MYALVQLGIADNRRLIRWASSDGFAAKLNLKGFDYTWIITSRQWSPSDRVLDVGAGYSALPGYLSSQFHCEVWAADDFGFQSGECFWERNKEPLEFINAHPEVKYVLERVGDVQSSSLPEGYFDCIYSASALEHVPPEQIANVWRHMDRLLKPGGSMLHGLDITLPTSRGLLSVAKALFVDYLWPLLPPSYRIRNAYYTPSAYIKLVASALQFRPQLPRRELGPIRLALDPHIALEPLDWAFNRFRKDGILLDSIPRMTSFFFELRKLPRAAEHTTVPGQAATRGR